MHALETLVSFFLSAVPNHFKYHQNATFTVLVFILFAAFLNCFKYCHNACFRDIGFIYFSAVPNRFKYHHSACFRDIVFIFLSAVSNTVRMYKGLYVINISWIQNRRFSIIFISFSAFPNRFKYHQNAPFTVLVFIFSLHFHKSFKIPSERMWMDSLVLPSSAKPSPINFNPFYSFKSSLVQSNPAQSSPVQFKLYLIQLNLHKYMLQDLLTLFHLLLPALYQQLWMRT